MDSGDFVAFPTYYFKWKTSFPKLKVSKPVKDICAYCYVFTNHHKYLANRGIGFDMAAMTMKAMTTSRTSNQSMPLMLTMARRVLLIQALVLMPI